MSDSSNHSSQSVLAGKQEGKPLHLQLREEREEQQALIRNLRPACPVCEAPLLRVVEPSKLSDDAWYEHEHPLDGPRVELPAEIFGDPSKSSAEYLKPLFLRYHEELKSWTETQARIANNREKVVK